MHGAARSGRFTKPPSAPYTTRKYGPRRRPCGDYKYNGVAFEALRGDIGWLTREQTAVMR